jgi:DNA-binding transcriptional regulator YiaG
MQDKHPIATLRQQYNLSQQGLADTLQDYPGFSKRSIENWEEGKRNCPEKKMKFIEKILGEKPL